MVYRSEDGGTCVEACENVSHRHPHLDRVASTGASGVHQTRMSLYQNGVSEAVGERTIRSVPSDGAPD